MFYRIKRELDGKVSYQWFNRKDGQYYFGSSEKADNYSIEQANEHLKSLQRVGTYVGGETRTQLKGVFSIEPVKLEN